MNAAPLLILGAALSGDDLAAELPRFAPVEPADAAATLTVAPPFRMELVAAEPLVADPIALAFDARGGLFVVEMRGYFEQPDESLGRVKRLTDADGDGVFDTAAVFADTLSWPTALFPWDGGLFVAAPPDLLYFKDTTGDGRADVRRVVLTGFGRGNVQGMTNSLRWGLDNRIHGAGSLAGGEIVAAGGGEAGDERPETREENLVPRTRFLVSGLSSPTSPITLGRRDFSFNPRAVLGGAPDFTPTTAAAQHGMCFDDWGRKFVCSNSDHARQVMATDRDLARNPHLRVASPLESIAADGPQAEIFRRSPLEPWRVVRTRLRIADEVPGPVERGGRVAGYFTAATGITVYRGDDWPDEWRGTLVVADAGSNLIHRKRLTGDGRPFTAVRIDEAGELVASADTWFRPVQFAHGPDGALYVADMYREVIEHPDSLPESIKRHLDLTAGRDRGRIWRLTGGAKAGTLQRPGFEADATTAELIATLAHPNGWHRDTAARLLYERQDRAAVAELDALLAAADTPAVGRVHALSALAGLDALEPRHVLAGLTDGNPRVREAAAGRAEKFAHDATVAAELFTLTGDPDPMVRYRLAYVLGGIRAGGEGAAAVSALTDLLVRDGANRWARTAALSSLSGAEHDVLRRLLGEAAFLRDDAAAPVLVGLAELVARRGDPAEIDAVLAALPDGVPGRAVLRGLLAGSNGERHPVRRRLADPRDPALRDRLAAMRAAAAATAIDPSRATAERVEAFRFLRFGPFEPARDAAEGVLREAAPSAVQRAAVETLAAIDGADVPAVLLDAWPGLTPAVRDAAAEALLATPHRAVALLDAIGADGFALGSLSAVRRLQLTRHRDAAIRERAQRLFAATGDRREIVRRYRPALELPGDGGRGRTLFRTHCAACHRVDGVGHAVGPNLAGVRSRGAEFVLVNLFDPGREVTPEFTNYLLLTTDGRTKTGVLAAESESSVTLVRAEGVTEVVPRGEIAELHGTGLSLMPEGLERQLDPRATADLLAYLMGL